jgi:hypothetical protein
VADDVVREPELALEICEAVAADELEDGVVPLGLLRDLVGEAALAPAVGAPDVATLGLDLVLDPADRALDVVLLEVTIDDDHELIGSHGEKILPVDPANRGPLRCGQGSVVERSDVSDRLARTPNP